MSAIRVLHVALVEIRVDALQVGMLVSALSVRIGTGRCNGVPRLVVPEATWYPFCASCSVLAGARWQVLDVRVWLTLRTSDPPR
eukprot:6458786-Pyramimonas_sp.AAC.1